MSIYPDYMMSAPLQGRRFEEGRRRRAVLPGGGFYRSAWAAGICGGVQTIVDEVAVVTGQGPARLGDPRGAGRIVERRALIHRRQIAMYVCHVVLRMTLTEIALAYGKDRTTVGHACRTVEDRRDDPGYDRFVAVVERLTAMFMPADVRYGI